MTTAWDQARAKAAKLAPGDYGTRLASYEAWIGAFV